jgi:hypothetical protein
MSPTPTAPLLLLEASYMDGGALPVAPLRGSQLIQLRTQRHTKELLADTHRRPEILSEKVGGPHRAWILSLLPGDQPQRHSVR